jgi:ligand-binding SRPBCC domain-containing protein
VSERPTTDTNSANQHSQRNDQSPSWRAPAVTIGPSVLLVLYAIVGTLATLIGALARPESRRRLLLRAPLVGGALLPWVYFLLVRPWHLNWSVTEEEAHRPLPYDHLVPRPVAQITHAITINAPADEVWKWLVQLGQGRGGMYSYDWLENLAALDMHSTEEIVPELQDLEVGDLVRLAPERMGAEAGLRVAAMEPGRALVLHQPADPESGRPHDREDPDLGNYYGWNWVFVLAEVDPDTTRLIVRSRVDGRPRYLIKTFYTLLLEFPHFVMERGMLKGIKRRAERASVGLGASQRFQQETVIERPVEEVFDFVTDARNEPRFNPRILSAQKTTPGPIGRGTHFVLMSKAVGRPMAVEYEITAYERPQRMSSHTIRGLPLVDVESVETFEPIADGTCMRWEWELRPRGAVGRLMMPVMARVLTSRLEPAFANIKRVLEAEAAFAAHIDERL